MQHSSIDRQMEELYGPVLDAMSLAEAELLLATDYERLMLRRMGVKAPLLRQALLSAVYRQQARTTKQPRLEF